MRLLLLGAPGSGKGTQAEQLSLRFNIPSISTGVIIRTAIRDKTELGLIAEELINNGQLVPDDVMIDLINERLSEPSCANGFILDGFPRTLNQAITLDKSARFDIDLVLTIEVPDETIIQRLAGRLECSKCGCPYHVKYQVIEGNICVKCGGVITKRDDDTEEIIKKRLDVYYEQTEEVKEYYRNRGKLRVALGHEDIAETTAEVLRVIGYVSK